MKNHIGDLPENVQHSLGDFISAATEVCGQNLTSVVLFGSAAEGRLRPTSDVNLILVFKEFRIAEIDPLRESLRICYAAIRLRTMFILESEISAASEAFAVKFTDVLNRHRILVGNNPFATLTISKAATIQRLKQVVVNLTLRLRERYAVVSLREEQLAPIIADVTGPIRACAATILRLEGMDIEHPKEALQRFTERMPERLPADHWQSLLHTMSRARENQELPPGQSRETLSALLELLKAMYLHIEGMQ